jgi:molybdopterin converting factor small subunit
MADRSIQKFWISGWTLNIEVSRHVLQAGKGGPGMKIRVKIDSNLRIKNVFEPPLDLELQMDQNSLGDVLQKLSDMYPHLSFTEQGDMGDDIRHVFLNGSSHLAFDEGLRRKLREGDTVHLEAYMEPLAGG